MFEATKYRKLKNYESRLAELKERLRVNIEQRISLAEEVDDLKIRALVSESPYEKRRYIESQKHLDSLDRDIKVLTDQIAQLEFKCSELAEHLMDGGMSVE